MKITVVGAGIIGAMTALRLCGEHQVTIIDHADTMGRTTDGSLAWLNVCTTGNLPYARLRKTALDLWHKMLRDHADVPVKMTGSLIWGDTAADPQERALLMQSIGWRAEVIDSKSFAKMAPGFAHPPQKALFVPDEGRADPKAIVHWTLRHAQAVGAALVSSRVLAVTLQDSGVAGVTLQDGTHLPADAVILAAGHGCAPLLQQLEVNLPVDRKPGFVVRSAPLPPLGDTVFGSEDLDFWQGADGRVLMASSLAKTSEDALDLAAQDALTVFHSMYPALEPRAEEVIQRDRPIPSDGVSLVGGVGIAGLYAAVTHSGVTLAPALAETLAQEIVTGTPLPVAAPFSPIRFTERKAS